MSTRESVSVDKEHSKSNGGQASVDNYKIEIICKLSLMLQKIQPTFTPINEHETTKLTLEESSH